jgi:serine/threonine protein phosphatase 1
MSSTYVIGDIHGCHTALVELLKKISPDPGNDFLIFLGDYIDRGPGSKDVLTTLVQLQQQIPRMITLKGNHEDAFLRYLSGKDVDFFLNIGGRQTLESYGLTNFTPDAAKKVIPHEHMQFLSNLLPFWEDDEYIYVHAGLKPGVHLSQQTSDWLFWADRERFACLDYNFGKRVIFGHTANPTPVVMPNKIGIDCGAVYGGKLTCLVLPDLDFVSVNCERYWPFDM